MPAPVLSDLVAPERCVLVTQECQGGVIGPQAGLPVLADEARREALPNITRLVEGARRAGLRVVHCTVQQHPDRLGANTNTRLAAAGKRSDMNMLPGSPGAAVLPELGPDPHDLVLPRYHGVGPMGGTELDAILRNMGATTIIGVGVSVNVAMLSFVMDAVNAGYWFVLPRDAVAGVPREYAEAVIDNTLSLVTTVTTTDDILAAW
jgi:nicotinamidase-related amidase